MNRVKEIRESKGMSRKDLAEKAKVSERNIAFVEDGHGISAPMMIMLSRALDVQPQELIR